MKVWEALRKFFASVLVIIGIFCFTKYLLLFISNEGASIETPVMINSLTVSFPMPDPLNPWLLFWGGILWASAMIVWPHPGGVRKYFRELLGKE